ncbi:uncharacterized protein EV420DRAFT_226670 [Desarmillaria tabescens]|uniref:C2H2-type domain-containing protein n=1 Tax=Armillaria tabescens TaxID=1929756 RepID=A0AA39N7Y7_ARMTA|nr:uncharacterized protein EV420DRAFT_226670 [Desarmillaria tabescens]KAK0460701.1 hypothetical protein EV420DRAFT_226670 [Desarmillaria tabescens]
MRSSSKKSAIQPDLFVCDFEDCNTPFVRKNDLNRHLRAHYAKGAHKCPHCDYSCDQATALKTHVNSVHLGLRPYACPDCEFMFGDKGSLCRHRKRRHGYEPKKRRTPEGIIKEVKEKRTRPLYIKRMSTLSATHVMTVATTITTPSPTPTPSPSPPPVTPSNSSEVGDDSCQLDWTMDMPVLPQARDVYPVDMATDVAPTTPSPSPTPSPPPVTPPSSNVDNDFWKLDWNMDMSALPQAREVYPADRAEFPLEGLFPTTTEALSSPFTLLDPFQPSQPSAEASGAFTEEIFASTFAGNYSAAADSDLADICADLFGPSVSSPGSDSLQFSSFEEMGSDDCPTWMGPFDFAFA